MKKLLLLLAVTFFISNYSIAQGNESSLREEFLFGLKIGTNLSNIYDTKGDALEADPKFGLAAGAFLSIPIGKYIGVQPELLLSQKGFHATSNFLGNSYVYTRTTTYIDVPLLIALKPSEHFTLMAGPQYSFLVRQKDAFDNIEQEQEFENDNLRKNILCFLGGFDININHFVFGARAGWDIQNNNGDGTSYSPRYKNVWYQGTIGIRFY